jgi:hypothetical protein
MKDNFRLIEVVGRNEVKKFLYGTDYIYKNHCNRVANLDLDIKNIFDRDKNPYFNNGDAKRWIIVSSSGNVLGRVAAFYTEKRMKVDDQPTGGLGFFECVDDFKVSSLLFNTAINWLKSNGLEAVDGPINFGENINYWGLLYEGYEQQSYGMQYHPEYYKKHFKEFGFKKYYKQYTFRMQPDDFPKRLLRIGEWVSKKQRFTAKNLDWDNVEEFSKDIAVAFNDIWSSYKKDHTPVSNKDILIMLEDAKLILDPKLVWVIYNNNKPIAFAIMMPDVNQLIKHTNGKFNYYNIIKLLFYKYIGAITRVRSIVIGVSPKFQKFGVEAFLFYNIGKVFDKSKYKELEFSWIGDFNTKMLNVIKAIGPKRSSTHVTYRYLFDRKKEFKRYPIE